jgi:hypothetical protein
MSTARRRTAASRRPSPSSGGGTRPHVTNAELEREVELVVEDRNRVLRQHAELRTWSKDARRMMALAALVLLCYAICLYSVAARSPARA